MSTLDLEIILLVGPVIVLAATDGLIHFLRNRNIYKIKNSDKESKLKEQPYNPNLRIWALGGVLGLGYFLLTKLKFPGIVASRSDAMQEVTESVSRLSSGNDPVEVIAGTILALGIIGLIVFGIVSIVRED